MLSGKAISRALRGHFRLESALTTNLLRLPQSLRNKMQLVEIYRIMKKDQQLRKKQKTQFPMMQLGLRSHFRALKKPICVQMKLPRLYKRFGTMLWEFNSRFVSTSTWRFWMPDTGDGKMKMVIWLRSKLMLSLHQNGCWKLLEKPMRNCSMFMKKQRNQVHERL